MHILTVPDVWPPIDCPLTLGLPCPQSTLFADHASPVDHASPADHESPADDVSPDGSGGLGQPTGGQAWPRQFAVLLAEALTGDRPQRQIQPWLSRAAACTCSGCCRCSAAASGPGYSGC